jgi:hypothetical protein
VWLYYGALCFTDDHTFLLLVGERKFSKWRLPLSNIIGGCEAIGAYSVTVKMLMATIIANFLTKIHIETYITPNQTKTKRNIHTHISQHNVKGYTHNEA